MPMGCATSAQTVEARNETSERLTLFWISGERGFSFQFGTLPGGIWKVYGGEMRIRRNETCEVSWLDSASKSHKVKVDLRDHLPKGYRGALKFVLGKDGKIRVYPRKN